MAELFVKKRENHTDDKRAAETKQGSGASIVLAPEKDLSFDELKKCAETARASRSVAVRVPPNKVVFTRNALSGSGVLTDCAVGGNGETTAQVKRYETKRAVRAGA